MKVLFIITGLGLGGAETQLIQMINYLARKKYEIKVIKLTGRNEIVPDNKNIEIIDLSLKRKGNSIYSLVRALILTVKECWIFRPEVVHSHMIHANILARLSRFFYRPKRLICTAHSNFEGGKIHQIIYKMTSGLCDEFTHVSLNGIKSFENQGIVQPDTMKLVYNGIDVNRFKYSASSRQEIRRKLGIENKKVVLTIASFKEAKDYPNLLNAFYDLCQVRNDCKLLVIGTGTEEEIRTVKNITKHLSLENEVIFLGLVHNVEQYLSSADCFVLASKWEGFGLVVAEAMSTSCPVVVTRNGGSEEVVEDCGVIVPAENAKCLSEKIDLILNLNEDEIKNIKYNARNRVIDMFDFESSMNSWIKIYNNEN